jgi:hypothetical protein
LQRSVIEFKSNQVENNTAIQKKIGKKRLHQEMNHDEDGASMKEAIKVTLFLLKKKITLENPYQK